MPIALPADAALPLERLIARLQSAMRVRALHATVLRRIELFAAHGGKLPPLPVGDALDDATVLIAGRGPLYPALSVAIGERVNMVGALSVEAAAKHLDARDIDGIVVGDGFSPRMVEAFLTVLAQEARFRDIPVAVIGDGAARLSPTACPTSITSAATRQRIVPRMVPLVRMHAFEARLKRMMVSLDSRRHVRPARPACSRATPSGAISTRRSPRRSDRSLALSLARLSFDGCRASAPASTPRG